MQIEQLLKAGIRLYTGRNVSHLEVFPDPKVDGAYAARAWVDDEEKMDFLMIADPKGPPRSAKDVERNLEEAEFTSWPPTSGKLRFFI